MAPLYKALYKHLDEGSSYLLNCSVLKLNSKTGGTWEPDCLGFHCLFLAELSWKKMWEAAGWKGAAEQGRMCTERMKARATRGMLQESQKGSFYKGMLWWDKG